MAKREKKPVHKVVMTEGKRQIIQQLLQEYDIETAEDIHDALKDLLGGTIKEMMEAEMDDYRNGYKEKTVNSSYGSMRIDVPQDRKSTFEPKVLKKRQKDISDIDQKIISMYAKGMTTRQISDTLMDIYGFEASEGFISDVTDKILPTPSSTSMQSTTLFGIMGSFGRWRLTSSSGSAAKERKMSLKSRSAITRVLSTGWPSSTALRTVGLRIS